jgi:hypothetical protein
MTRARNPQGIEGDVIQGKTCIVASKKAGVKRVVYSSVNSLDRCNGTVIFECKLRVDQPPPGGGVQVDYHAPGVFHGEPPALRLRSLVPA